MGTLGRGGKQVGDELLYLGGGNVSFLGNGPGGYYAGGKGVVVALGVAIEYCGIVNKAQAAQVVAYGGVAYAGGGKVALVGGEQLFIYFAKGEVLAQAVVIKLCEVLQHGGGVPGAAIEFKLLHVVEAVLVKAVVLCGGAGEDGLKILLQAFDAYALCVLEQLYILGLALCQFILEHTVGKCSIVLGGFYASVFMVPICGGDVYAGVNHGALAVVYYLQVNAALSGGGGW